MEAPTQISKKSLKEARQRVVIPDSLQGAPERVRCPESGAKDTMETQEVRDARNVNICQGKPQELIGANQRQRPPGLQAMRP
jgi:hypothetical protein